jgi:hypothetical protein
LKNQYHCYTKSDNKVRELATVCLPWQQWTETSVWFDDVGIAFTDVLLLSYGSLILSGIYYCLCFGVRRENVGTNIKFLVKLGKNGSEIREMLVQVYGDNAMKKTAVYKRVARFSEGSESVIVKERSGRPARRELKKTLQKFVKLCVKIVG